MFKTMTFVLHLSGKRISKHDFTSLKKLFEDRTSEALSLLNALVAVIVKKRIIY